MKHRILLLLCVLAFASACNDPDPVHTNLALSADALSTGQDGGTLSVAITCNSDWQLSGATAWCTPDKTSGQGNATLTLTVSAYDDISAGSRQATLTVSSGTQSKTVTITQNIALSAYHYELPVVFHVLRGPADSETIRAGWLSEIINVCNENYMGLQGNSPDINLQFVLADKKPDGTALSEPGLNYVSWSTSTIDPDVFMSSTNPDPKAVALLWDLNQYINVFIYDFGTGTNANTTGIAFLPYGIKANPLPGLQNGDVYLTRSPEYVHCVSLNRAYLYERSNSTQHNPSDITATLSHELGHYLGLYHAFSKSQCGEDDDYCADTPDYNRAEYDSWLNRFLETATGNILMAQVAERTACDGSTFTSRNFMDYYFCYSDQFTADQAKRIRYVLSYSPLMPGPKYERTTSKSAEDLEIPPAIKMP